jgi:hypothetical protein
MQTASFGEAPDSVFADELSSPTRDRVLLAFEGFLLVALLLGAPVAAATYGGAVDAVLVVLLLIAVVVAVGWRLGLEFERGWRLSEYGPLIGESDPVAGFTAPGSARLAARYSRAPDIAPRGRSRAPTSVR